MAFGGMNYFAIPVAAGASFVFGAAYYFLFRRQWTAALGRAGDETKIRGSRSLPFAVAAIAELIMAFVLAGSIGHLGPGRITIMNGMISGAILWAGLVLTSTTVNYAFQGARPSLTLIDCGHWLCVLLIQGFVIGFIGV